MSIVVNEVKSARDLSAFITIPRRLYHGMAGYAPPLDHERRMLLDPRKSSFHTHGKAAYWIARQNGQDVGRISAQIDHLSTRAETGFFGCLDTIDSAEVVASLLAAAESWLAARGRRSVQGPYLLSMNGEAGLLTEGHDAPPVLLMPWHPVYLKKHLISAGYCQVQSLLSFAMHKAKIDPVIWARLMERANRGSEFTLRRLRMNDLPAEGEIVRTLFNDAWSENWGFAPLVQADLNAMLKGFKPFLHTDYAVIAELGGKPVGFLMALPNLMESAAGLNGQLGLTGLPRFLWRSYRNKYDFARIILMGVSAHYRVLPLGAEIAIAMIVEIVRRSDAHHFRAVEAGWVLEGNKPVVKIIERIGFKRTRTFGIFERRATGEGASR